MTLSFPRRLTTTSPVLSPSELQALAKELLDLTSGDTASVSIDHRAMGTARVARGEIRLNESGDWLGVTLSTQFGHRVPMSLNINQLDRNRLRQAIAYVDRIAREQPGDPIETTMPIAPQHYGSNTAWKESTLAAFFDGRHAAARMLAEPVINAKLTGAAFIGVWVHSRCVANKQGLCAAGLETDAELTVTAWNADGKGRGWAGQAARDWDTLRPDHVAQEAIRLTRLAANPQVVEPGRRTAILGPAAVAQLVCKMGTAFDAQSVLEGAGPLYDRRANRVRFNERILDARLTLSSDPNDPEGGYLPFNTGAYPLVAMTWLGKGAVLENLAYRAYFAAERGITPSNDPPESFRMGGGTTSIEEMIANCKDGIYVNRVADVEVVRDGTGLTGVTNGGCYLIRNGKIDRSVRDFRFVESPWFFLNRLIAVGPTARASFGYSPWQGGWPAAPTIVPPMMIRDFNFVALAEAV